MLMRNFVIGAAALACTAAATTVSAGQAVTFSSDTGNGSFASRDWNGGNLGGDLSDVMDYVANYQGDFAGFDTRRNQVNMFVVDFSSSNTTYTNAGLTLFVMWGNINQADGGFVGDVDVSPPVTLEDDGTYNAGTSNIYALGAGVSIDDDGPVSVDVDVDGNSTPVGFAITNINSLSGFGETGLVNLQFTLAQAIRRVRLMGGGDDAVWIGVDDDGTGEIFTDGIVLSVIPAPQAALWGLAGLGGLAVARRRRK